MDTLQFYNNLVLSTSFEYKVAKEDRTTDTAAIGRVQKIIANKIGLSSANYYRAKKIIKESPESVKDRVRSGKVTISKAYKQLQKEQKRKQFLLLANSESRISFPEGVKLIQGDFVEFSKDIPDNSIDLVFTESPYGEEYLYLYKSLFEVAQRVLKESGSLIAYCGHIALAKILRYAEESGLTYWWILCLKHSGASARVYGRNMIADWKPTFSWLKALNRHWLFSFDNVLILKNIPTQLGGTKMNHDDKLSGTLLVNCTGSACRRVIQESKKMEGVTFVFRVDKKSREEPDVIIDVSGGKDLIQKVEINIKKIDGVHSISHEIGSSLLY